MDSVVKRRYRSELNRIDWDFTGEQSADGFAAYHWYPARYVPQLPGILLGYFSDPGEIVLDPFCGSGTTLVESYKLGRRPFGIDVNPVATLMAAAKLAPFEEKTFDEYRTALLDETARDLGPRGPLLRNASVIQRVPSAELASWFHIDTLRELCSIWGAITKRSTSVYDAVGKAAFSAILKYSCSQDKHWGWVCDNVRPKELIYKAALARYADKLQEFGQSARRLHEDAAALQEERIAISEATIVTGSCTSVLANRDAESVGAVVTSPPYFNMTDYVLSQRLSNLWFGIDMVGVRTDEIGARYRRSKQSSRSEYLRDMGAAFAQIARVLRRGGFCAVVIGESPRHAPVLDDFVEICRTLGLKVRERITRRVPRKRSLSPSLEVETVLIMRKS